VISSPFDPLAPTTTIGVLGGRRDATVDRCGVTTPRAAGWELDWWIGADDRWHVPSREAAVRQELLDGMPVVHTAMRVPGGDAVQRAYAVPVDDVGEVAVLEIANESPAPLGWVPIDGQMVIVASYGGGRNHPNWYYNLLAEPNATIEVGTKTRDVRARRLEGEERERLWKTATELVPGFGDYQTRADEYGRQIQIFVLEPR